MSLNPYRALDVIDAFHKIDGRRWFVRDAETSFIFLLVEYVDRRLTCFCEQGEAHAEAPDTELPCAHLKAVVDQRMADNTAAGPKLGVLRPSVFCD